MGEFVAELWAFMKERKKFWLLPIILVLMLFSVLIVFTQGSALAPFVYTLF
jgi:competence protein ComGC